MPKLSDATLSKLRERDARLLRRKLQRKALILQARRKNIIGTGVRQTYRDMVQDRQNQIERLREEIAQLEDRLEVLPSEQEQLQAIDRQIAANDAELALITQVHNAKRLERQLGRFKASDFLRGIALEVWEEMRGDDDDF